MYIDIYLNSLIHMHIYSQMHTVTTYIYTHALSYTCIHMLTHAHTNTHRETWSCFFPVHNLEVFLTTTYTVTLNVFTGVKFCKPSLLTLCHIRLFLPKTLFDMVLNLSFTMTLWRLGRKVTAAVSLAHTQLTQHLL